MNLVLDFFLVAIGSALGGMARYGSGLLIGKFWRDAFPLATFVINVTGSFMIGALAGWLAQDHPSEAHHSIKLLLIVGVCGGFTTFSSFSLEALNLLRSGQWAIALTYTALSVLVCITATAIGYALYKAA